MSAQKFCKFCSTGFKGRKNRKFCSDSCRVQYSRLPATVKKMKQDAIASISKMRRAAREFPHLAKDVRTALQDIIDDLDLHQI